MSVKQGRVMPFLNLTDDHRRLHLRQSEVEPTLVCVLLFCEDRPVAYAHADVQRCRFSVSSDGPLFWAGDANFLITEQERREIERFLCELAEALVSAGLTLRYRDGQVVLTRAPLPIHRDVPAFLRSQAG